METIVLPASLDVTTVRQMYDVLSAARASKSALTIDGTAVETVDLAGAQLLAAFAIAAGPIQLKASAPLQAFLELTAIDAVLTREP
jgi:anti-anti-sigma regulatory factor